MTVTSITNEIKKLALAGVDSVLRSVLSIRKSLLPKPPAPPKWLHKGKMYAFTDPKCEDGDVFEGCNMMQVNIDTAILVGKKVTLRSCQLTNVKLNSNMTIEGGNTSKWDYCSHLHPKWVQFRLPVCKEFCRHFKETTPEGNVYEDKFDGQSPLPKVVSEIGVN